MRNGKPELDLQEIGAVLKRDAARTDYLVLPLAASVLAHLSIATAAVNGAEEPELQERAAEGRRLLDSAAADDGSAWHADARLYADVQLYVIDNWDLFDAWLPITYRYPGMGDQKSSGNEPHMERCLKWLKDNSSAPLLDCMLYAAIAVNYSHFKENESPLLARSSRSVRVLLAQRLKRLPDSSWPAIMRAVQDEWTAEHLARHALLLANAAHAAIELMSHMERVTTSFKTKLDAAEARPVVIAAPAPPAEPAELHSQRERNRLLETELSAARQQSALHSERAGRTSSHVATVEERLKQAQARIGALEAELEMADRDLEEFKALFHGPDDTQLQSDVLPGAFPRALPPKRSSCSTFAACPMRPTRRSPTPRGAATFDGTPRTVEHHSSPGTSSLGSGANARTPGTEVRPPCGTTYRRGRSEPSCLHSACDALPWAVNLGSTSRLN